MAAKKRATSASGVAVQTIPLDEIFPAPWNPRQRMKGLDELAASIAASGLDTPILVRPIARCPKCHPADGYSGEACDACDSTGWTASTTRKRDAYQIVYGHRRVAACERLGLESIDAIVREIADDDAREKNATENIQREELSPMEESRCVAALLRRPGATIADVADKLGKPAGWAARRARLASLSATWQSLVEEEPPFSGWHATWLEEIAKISPEAQDRLYAERGRGLRYATTRSDVQSEVEEYIHILASAPWSLDDAGLLPEVGPCRECRSRSSQEMLLFADDPETQAANKDCCLNADCWQKKKAAYVDLQKRQMAMEYGEVVYVSSDYAELSENKSLVPQYAVETVKEGAKGTRPALIVDVKHPDAGKKIWIRRYGKTDAGEAAPKTLKEKRAQLAKRRKKRAIAAFVDAVDRSVLRPTHEELCRLVLAFGKDRPSYAVEKAAWGNFRRLQGGDLDAELWAAVKPEVVRWIAADYRDAGEAWDGAGVLAEMLSIDLAAMHVQAVEQIPEPKSWTAEKARQKVAKKKEPAK